MNNRDYQYRKFRQKTIVIRRLKRICNKGYFFRGINGVMENPRWIDYIGSETALMFKTYVTNYYDSRDKAKWGKKGRRTHHWFFGKEDKNRVSDKQKFLMELKELYSENNI